MKTAVLRGGDHPTLGAVAAVGEGPVAVALSRGGAAKRYAHTDPNEDAVAFAEGPAGILLAVADGHGGCRGSELAVEHLVARCAGAWTGAARPDDWDAAARTALFEAGAAIRAGLPRDGSPPPRWRTTLALALLRPAEDWLGWASVGDSHAFLVEDADATDLAISDLGRVPFLGHPKETPETLATKCVIGSRALAGARAVALVTDGLSERGIGVAAPSAAVASAARRARAEGLPRDRAALETALGIVERALEAQRRQRAGDNVGVAIAWLS